MTAPFRKSLVLFVFSSPPETPATFHVSQCGAPPGADHMCLPLLWRLGTYWPWDNTLAHSQGVHLGEGTKGEHREGESWALLLLTPFFLPTPNWPPLCPIHPPPHLRPRTPAVKQGNL